MLTMYVMLTLENLPENVDMGLAVSPWTVLFFISYSVILSFLVFNLFIGIVLNSMEEARAADRKKHERDDLLERLRSARQRSRMPNGNCSGHTATTESRTAADVRHL